MDRLVSQKRAGSLLLHLSGILDHLRELDPVPVQVAILGAHEDKVAALSPGQSVALAHHQRHVIKLVDFKRVED